MAPDGSSVRDDTYAPYTWTGKPRAKMSQKPIILIILPVSGIRSYYQLAMLLNIADSLGLPPKDMATIFAATSGGAAVSSTLVMPLANGNKSLTKAEYQASYRSTANALLEPQAKGIINYRYSLRKTEKLFHGFWGNNTMAEANTGLAIFAYDSNSRQTVTLTNISRPGHMDTSWVRACDAVASTIAIPRLFREKQISPTQTLKMPVGYRGKQVNGWMLSDGFRQAAFPLRQGLGLARYMRGESNVPIYVLGITSGYDRKKPDRSRWFAPMTCKESCRVQQDKAIDEFNYMVARGDVDGLIIDEKLAGFVPGISESPIDGSFENIDQLQRAADKVAEKYERRISRELAPLCGVQ